MKITIPSEIIGKNQVVSFWFGTPNFAGQEWSGVTKGTDVEVGDYISVRRQIGPDTHEQSRVRVLVKDCPVTGDIILTLAPEGRAAE